MLSLLRIKDLAIIDQVEVELRAGLNIITGETGAGKSVILRAIELLLGKRCSGEVVRGGRASCEVEGLFALPTELLERLRTSNDDFANLESEVILRRVVDPAGKSRFYLNGRLVPAAAVQLFSGMLIDFTGQHQQQLLFAVDTHREFLDSFGVDPDLLAKVRAEFLRYRDLLQRLTQLRDTSSQETKRLKLLEEEVAELSQAQLQEGERGEIESELNKLSSVEHLRELVSQAFSQLDDDQDGVSARLRKIKSLLSSAEAIDEQLGTCRELLESAQVTLDETGLSMERYLSGLDDNPSRLEELRERLSQIARLERKYGRSCDELVSYAQELGRELAVLGGSGVDLRQLEQELNQVEARLRAHEVRLHEARVTAATKLSAQVVDELHGVALPKARFVVEVTKSDSSIHGADRVRFLFSANPGSEPAPLDAVASGGELSRVLLVLKSILSENVGAPVQVYDEVDVGIGGAVAQVVGEKLQQIAKQAQTIVVTHAPQIASLADAHFCVEKRLGNNETRVLVRELDGAGRVREIARMLAGKKITVEFEASAKELLGANPIWQSSRKREASRASAKTAKAVRKQSDH